MASRDSSIWVLVVLASVAALLFPIISATHVAAQTDKDAREFVEESERALARLRGAAAAAHWSNSSDQTPENSERAQAAESASIEESVTRAKLARHYSTSDVDVLRKLKLLALAAEGLNSDPMASRRRTQLVQEMDAHYEQACAFVDADRPCLRRDAIESEMRTSRDPERLRRLWLAWYDTARPQALRYKEYIALVNEGARDSGKQDASELSFTTYDTDAASFERDLDAMWVQIRPLYRLLHSYARARLAARYPGEVDPKGPIPIHLLGNLWGQEWEGIADILAPTSDGSVRMVAFERLGLPPARMARVGEGFFTSLGFPSLPQRFWELSYFARPTEADGVPKANFGCHPTAHLISSGDWRVRTCLTPSWADFLTVHHELGHVFYYQSFDHQPFLFRSAPNGAINEAVGDAVMLSVTSGYLRAIGLSEISVSDGEIDELLGVALRKIVRIPFGLMLERWRSRVLSGQIAPATYNLAWWDLVLEYQGIAPPTPRDASAFDPAAKKHIAADVDYFRYILADVLTFQIHEALSRRASCAYALHRCSIYRSLAAGSQLRNALASGSSQPWKDVLRSLTDSPTIQGEALRAYFSPLVPWLEEHTRGLPIGWE